MVARSSLLRRLTPGARSARRTSSVVAALAALAPRLVRLAHHDYPDRLLVSDAPARVHRRPPALGAPAVGALPALRPVEGVRARGAGRGDRLSRRRRRERSPPPRRLPPALRAPRRIVRAGEERASEPGLRLRHAAHRALGLDDPRAAGPEPDAAPVPRAIPHHEGVARLVRGPDLPLHQQEERAVHARRRGLALGPPRVPPRPDRPRVNRPETLSRVGNGRERVTSVDRAQAVPRPSEPGRTLAVPPDPRQSLGSAASAYTSRWGRCGAPARARRRMPPP